MSVADNLKTVNDKIAAASCRVGRSPGGVVLVAVSKNFPVEMVTDAAAAGQVHFGENRIQEARSKIPDAPPGLVWHLVGTLQKNKVKYAVRYFQWIHSVDSIELARELNKRLLTTGWSMNVLVEVKLSPEETKFGIAPGDAEGLVKEMAGLESLNARGLMTISPFDPDPESARPYFRELSSLAASIRAGLGLEYFDQLSMGMSNDYEVAVEEGATMVRIGTAVFGPRSA